MRTTTYAVILAFLLGMSAGMGMDMDSNMDPSQMETYEGTYSVDTDGQHLVIGYDLPAGTPVPLEGRVSARRDQTTPGEKVEFYHPTDISGWTTGPTRQLTFRLEKGQGQEQGPANLRRLDTGKIDCGSNTYYCDGSDLIYCSGYRRQYAFFCSEGCDYRYLYSQQADSSCRCSNQQACSHGSLDRYCNCNCPSPWSGDKCDVCDRTAEFCNGGTLNSESCSCECPDNMCLHDGVVTESCGCNCPSPWTGERCGECPMTADQCVNNGTVSESCDCTCPNSCVHGTRNDDCSCSCEQGWKGDLCDRCDHPDDYCLAGGSMDNDTCLCDCPTECVHGQASDRCECTCDEHWTGENCSICMLDQEQCGTGELFDLDSCDCICQDSIECAIGIKTTPFVLIITGTVILVTGIAVLWRLVTGIAVLWRLTGRCRKERKAKRHQRLDTDGTANGDGQGVELRAVKTGSQRM